VMRSKSLFGEYRVTSGVRRAFCHFPASVLEPSGGSTTNSLAGANFQKNRFGDVQL
jgi:hypothetical protein